MLLKNTLKMKMRMKGVDCCDEVQKEPAQLERWGNCRWGRESPWKEIIRHVLLRILICRNRSPDLCLLPNIFLSP